MARTSFEVTYGPTDETRIPDCLTEGVSLLMDLLQRGVVAEVGERLRIRRQGGYSAVDVWVLLLLYFSTGAPVGVREFWEVIRPHLLEAAAMAGRRQLASPSSVSRALNVVEPDLLRNASSWLLEGVSEIDKVLVHPEVQTRDACGQGWHVFDLDPTVSTLRQRALPEDDELPEARRRSQGSRVGIAGAWPRRCATLPAPRAHPPPRPRPPSR